MSKGLRFNAKKEKAGKYFSTQIWSFDMKCYSCDQHFKIVTDPKNSTYDFAEGLRKQEQDYIPDVNDSAIVVDGEEEKLLIEKDPMYKLQHVQEDRRRQQSAMEQLEELEELQERQHRRDYDMNSLLRSASRKRKQRDAELLQQGRGRGLAMALVEPSRQDALEASQVSFRSSQVDRWKVNERQRLASIQQGSIFSSSSSVKKRNAPSANNTTSAVVDQETVARILRNVNPPKSESSVNSSDKCGGRISTSKAPPRSDMTANITISHPRTSAIAKSTTAEVGKQRDGIFKDSSASLVAGATVSTGERGSVSGGGISSGNIARSVPINGALQILSAYGDSDEDD